MRLNVVRKYFLNCQLVNYRLLLSNIDSYFCSRRDIYISILYLRLFIFSFVNSWRPNKSLVVVYIFYFNIILCNSRLAFCRLQGSTFLYNILYHYTARLLHLMLLQGHTRHIVTLSFSPASRVYRLHTALLCAEH